MNITYYNERYFDWQREIGEFEGEVGLFKFKYYINSSDNVIDFGCGGGYLLKNLICNRKIGIEPNVSARRVAESRGIKVYDKIEEIPDNFADVIISNHALEHVLCPYEVVKSLKRKVKVGGKLIFVVPHQGPNEEFKEEDVNQHLYTWNPLTLGNLFKVAGYRVIKVEKIRHMWPPRFRLIKRFFGEELFHLIARIYAILKNNYQIRIIVEKPDM